MGSSEHQARTWRNEGLHNAKVLFEALPRLPTAQGGLVLLRSCGVPKFSYYLRVTPPRTGAAVGSEFDQALASAFSDLTRVPLTELNEHRGEEAPSTGWAQVLGCAASKTLRRSLTLAPSHTA